MTLEKKKLLANQFQISLATLSNWIRCGVIDNDFEFDECTPRKIERLESRANRLLSLKRQRLYLGIKKKERKTLLDSSVDQFSGSCLSLVDGVMALLYRLVVSASFVDEGCFYEFWAEDAKTLGIDKNRLVAVSQFFANFTIDYQPDDFAGAFYQSISSVGDRSKLGAFYTPANLLDTIKLREGETVYDPCCGSGGMLIALLHSKIESHLIYASDIDPIALMICKYNLILFYKNLEMKAHLFVQDVLDWDKKEVLNADRIITNPPWGSRLSNETKLRLQTKFPSLETSEIFVIALFFALQSLRTGGELHFFLPESFLNIGVHRGIRKYLVSLSNRYEIKLLGQAFPGVLSKAILFKATHQSPELIVNGEHFSFQEINAPDYLFPASTVGQGQVKQFDKAQNLHPEKWTNIQGHAQFGMGIVTGNNSRFLVSQTEYLSNSEAFPCYPIFRGKNIIPFQILPTTEYLIWQPTLYQQTLPESSFRRRKIVYRFISSKLVFAIDEGGQFFLNSGNFFIPDGFYPWESIVTLFNSEVYQNYFSQKYATHRVLKKHIQQLPLPVLSSKEHALLKEIYNEAVAESVQSEKWKKKYNFQIMELLKL